MGSDHGKSPRALGSADGGWVASFRSRFAECPGRGTQFDDGDKILRGNFAPFASLVFVFLLISRIFPTLPLRRRDGPAGRLYNFAAFGSSSILRPIGCVWS